MKILLDTNVIIDIALQREPFYSTSAEMLLASSEGGIICCITTTIVTDIYYIVKKFKGIDFAVDFIKSLLSFVDVIDVNKSIILSALYSNWKDFEDAVQGYSAILNGIDIIITRNKADYEQLKEVKVLTTEEFLKYNHHQ